MGPDRQTSETAVEPGGGFEKLLLQEKLVDEKQLVRARKISSRLKERKPVGQVLVELGQLTQADHDRLVQDYRARMGILEILLEEGALTPAQADSCRCARESRPRIG